MVNNPEALERVIRNEILFLTPLIIFYSFIDGLLKTPLDDEEYKKNT